MPDAHQRTSPGLTGAGEPAGAVGPGQAGADPPVSEEPAPVDVAEETDDIRRDLKKEAMSAEHLLTHFPKNEYSSACQRARLRRRPIGTRSEKVERAETFGDIIICDHIVASRDEAEGLLSDKTAMAVYDMATHFTACYPPSNRRAQMMPAEHCSTFVDQTGISIMSTPTTAERYGRPSTCSASRRELLRLESTRRTLTLKEGTRPSWEGLALYLKPPAFPVVSGL